MATKRTVYEFKKGEIYGVDALEVVPKSYFIDYFDSEYEGVRNGNWDEPEWGSGLCIKSFTITIIISD